MLKGGIGGFFNNRELIGVNPVALIAEIFRLKSLGQGGVAGGLKSIGWLKILPAPAKVFFDELRSPDPRVVPGTRAEAVNADTFLYIVSGTDI